MYKYIHNWDIPFTEGENTLLAISGEVKDLSSIKFTLHPYKYNNESREFKTLSLLLGTNRYYKDPETKVVWMPDQPYREGSFGHIGGVPYKLPNSGRTPFGTDLDILLTDNDPI
ncbi:MAG: glycoside hydrolase family 2, partial [Fermentimonas sp.]|nr:glycoside hydrolase family 2 [Fermentimonas sp.]